MPFLEAPPIAPKNDKGTEITRAQGQDITKKVKARINQSGRAAKYPVLENRGGKNARTTAASTTAGV